MIDLRDRPAWMDFTCLALVAWLAHFFFSPSFGLYEDDYAFISTALDLGPAGLLDYARSAFTTWVQGRPLGFLLPRALTMIGVRLDGMQGVYILGFLVVALNALLFYLLLRRLQGPRLALIGALAFTLFPADTTHSFLTHDFQLQPSLTFLLAACLLYLSGRRVLSYAAILGSLITYESPYPVFLAVPLLASQRDRLSAAGLARHAAILLGLMGVAIALRAWLGESRVVGLDGTAAGLPFKIAAGVAIGPVVSLAMLGRALTLVQWSRGTILAAAAVCAGLAWMLWRPAPRAAQTADEDAPQPLLRLSLAAWAMLALAYALAFTHYPPLAWYGRLTSVHLAAACGTALLVACAAEGLLRAAESRRLLLPAVLALALYFALVTGYRITIQRDFVRAWRYQQDFWGQVVGLAPDLDDGTIVLVLDHNLPQTHYILTNSWGDTRVLQQLFAFPSTWAQPPRLFVVDADWGLDVIAQSGLLLWKDPYLAIERTLVPANVIVLEMEDGRLVRHTGTVETSAGPLALKILPPDAVQNRPRLALYELLIPRPGPGAIYGAGSP